MVRFLQDAYDHREHLLPQQDESETELEPPEHQLAICDKFEDEEIFCGLEKKLTAVGLMEEPGFLTTFQDHFKWKFPASSENYKSPVHYFKPWYQLGTNCYQGEVDRDGIQEGRTIQLNSDYLRIGHFREGQLHGSVSYYCYDGNWSTYQYREGKFHGQAIHHYYDGSKKVT